MKKMKILDLFSGIGGFSYGFEKTGKFKTVAFCEIDEHARKVLNKHWPDTPIFEDVSKLNGYELYGIDVICGGFPCQDVSIAGKKKGLIDENGEATRSGLWFQYKRLIEEIRPKYVVIENVKNLLNNGFATVLKDLHEIGYNAEWHVISARTIGACHLRERVWIIAYAYESTLRHKSEWEKEGRNGVQSEGQAKPSNNGKERDIETPNSNDFRLWRSFATEKEKCEWWSKTASSLRSWWKTQSDICGIYDGLSGRLYENARKQRIKQLGNSIVPQIAEFIAERIIEYETKAEKIECL
jgi:DNA (cytosine-5)-methyltransferase 1